jgi:hypothetical protein
MGVCRKNSEFQKSEFKIFFFINVQSNYKIKIDFLSESIYET